MSSRPPRPPQEEFDLAVAEAAKAFQLLEAVLVQYVRACFNLAHARVYPSANFHYKKLHLRGKSLGSLIKLVDQYCPDAALVRSLQDIPAKRNRLIHEAYLAHLFSPRTDEQLLAEAKEFRELGYATMDLFTRVATAKRPLLALVSEAAKANPDVAGFVLPPFDEQ